MAKVIGALIGLTSAAWLIAPTKPYSDKWSAAFLDFATAPHPHGTATQGWFALDLDFALNVVAGYLLLVSYGLLMKKKEDEKENNSMLDTLVKGVQMVYNLAQVFLCAYMIWGVVNHAIQHNYSFLCNGFNPKETGMAAATHIFYLSKIFDFCDTLFMVLRGKWKQFSFLHIYHHVSIFLVYWMNMNAGYDGDVYFTVALNSFVHLVMYSYYFLATLGYQPWWKKYITLLQMGQFLLMNVQAIVILVFNCGFPRNITIIYLVYVISIFMLFQNFYQRSYKKVDAKPATKSNVKKSQ